MSVSISQYIDLLFKKLQGVAKTANSTVKIYSNESIASPPLLRGDVIWMQASEIPSVAGTTANIANARINSDSVQCVADITVPPIGGVRPTWLTNVPRWIPQEFGATWQPQVYVGPPGASNIQATGTQIFSSGIGGVGEYYFDTQAGVLNFIGETIPSVLTSGNVVYVSGYEYVGALGVGNNPGNVTLGNLTISNTTISTSLATGNITLATTGNELVYISGTSGLAIPVGNTQQRPETPAAGTLRFNSGSETVEVYTGSTWQSAGSVISNVTNQTIVPDGVSDTYTLDQSSTAVNILVSINGISQTPVVDYIVSGDQITFTTVPLITDIVQVRYIANTATVVEISNTTGNSAVQVTDTPAVVFKVDNYNVAEFDANRVLNMSASRGLQLPTYTVAEATALPSPAAGQVIYVSNGDSGAACLAVYSDGAWRRVNLGTAISA
jgi:hypothetical protein